MYLEYNTEESGQRDFPQDSGAQGPDLFIHSTDSYQGGSMSSASICIRKTVMGTELGVLTCVEKSPL
jgi:hypothetical protein